MMARVQGLMRSGVLASFVAAALLGGGACGKDKKAGTTPSTGSVTAGGSMQGQPGTPGQPGGDAGGGGAAAGGGDTTAGGAPEEPPAPPIQVPGQDLDPGKKAEIVSQRITGARALLRSNNYDGVIQEAQGALDVDETNVDAMVLLAHAYYMKQYDDKAEAILNIAKKRPEGAARPELWMILGLVADRSPNNEREGEALAAYEQASSLNPNYTHAWANRGAIYLKRKRWADAVAAMEKVISLESRSPKSHTNLGSAYRGRSTDFASDAGQREGMLRKSEQEYKLAMTQDPNYAPAYFNLGLLYLDADPFPGQDPLTRLNNALRFLKEYKTKAGAALTKADPVEEYLVTAQKEYDKAVKREEQRKKKEAAAKAKAAKDAAQPAPPAGGNQ